MPELIQIYAGFDEKEGYSLVFSKVHGSRTTMDFDAESPSFPQENAQGRERRRALLSADHL